MIEKHGKNLAVSAVTMTFIWAAAFGEVFVCERELFMLLADICSLLYLLAHESNGF